MRSFVFASILSALVLASPIATADSVVVVLEAPKGLLDAERIRASIGRELHVTAVPPEDTRAKDARGRLTIAGSSASSVTVTYRKLKNGENDGSSPAVVRAVTLPPEPARAESTVTILASNLARDEAGELLGGLTAAPPSSRSTSDAVTSLVNRHREAKKKTALSQIDESLAFEQKELVKAREVAIQRLETLVATYATRAPANETADAMFRLAALYEERAQASADKVALETGLRAAIVLYQRIVSDFPNYRERAAVHYYLGHALNDVGELRDAQVAWRSLVCANHFTYQSTPAKRGPAAMPGDADEAYWASWRRRYATPTSIAKSNPETVYVEVFPEDCAPIPSGRSDASRYVVEAWWQIGSYEFDQLDAASGATREMPTTVWGYNRAASAFERGLHFFAAPGAQASPIHAALLYKYAWTLFKQQRYELATKTFVRLLEQTDTQKGGADFHDEAVTYIAGALTSADFRGPEAWAPFVPRLEELPAREREASRSAVRPIDRLKALVPQDKSWTIDVYRALAVELRGLDQHADAAFALEVIAQRWPLDRSAPETQKAIADTWDQALSSAKQGSPEHARIADAALKARRKLAAYAGATAWTSAHKDEPLVLRRGEGIARAALHETGARYTNAARVLLDAKKLNEALATYDLAADAWQALADITPAKGSSATEIDDARYWLADALHRRVRLRVSLRELDVRSPEPSHADIERAVAAAKAAQRSPAEAAHRENAAMFVVDLRDVDRDLAYLHARETSGARGVARRDEVRFDSADPAVRRPVKDNVPDVVQRSIDAREEYIRTQGGARSVEYAYWIAETLFLYGQWDQARPRLETLWRSRCAVDGVGFKAWSRLATMAAAERDVSRVLFLAEAVDPKRGGKSCDADGETRVVDPMRRAALQTRAEKRFEELCAATPCRPPETPAKKAEWIEVGVLFEQALAASIADDDAPRLALSGAYAFKLGGQPARGIPLYEKVIAEHATRANGPKALGDVYGALASAYVALFDYARAADTYAKLAERGGSVAEETRRDAARNAMSLFASLRSRADMDRMHDLLARLHPSSETQAAADFLVAMYEFNHRDGSARSSAASAALVKFFDANRTNAAAAKYVTEAAWSIAALKRADGDRRGAKPWLTRTIEARDRSRALGQIDPEADRLAAGAAFELLDEEITASFDAPGHHTYPTSAAEVFERYRLRAEEAKRWSDRLDREVITKYASREWTVAAWARQGALFDALRSGLYFNTTATKGLDEKGEALVRALRAAHRDEAADKLEDTARDVWQQRRQKELDAADALLIDRYAKAVFTAKKLDMTSTQVARARARLVYFTEMLGEPVVQKHVENTVDPTSPANAMLRYEQGMFAIHGKGGLGTPMTAPDSDPKPLPAVP